MSFVSSFLAFHLQSSNDIQELSQKVQHFIKDTKKFFPILPQFPL